MTEGRFERHEQAVPPHIFNSFMREAIQLAQHGKNFTYEEESRWFDNENFGDIDQSYVVGKLSSDRIPFKDANLWIQAKVYNESINALSGKHALGTIYVDVEDDELEPVFSLKYKLFNDGSITKHYFKEQWYRTNPPDIANAKSFVEELGIDPETVDNFYDWQDKQEVSIKELETMVQILSSIRH